MKLGVEKRDVGKVYSNELETQADFWEGWKGFPDAKGIETF